MVHEPYKLNVICNCHTAGSPRRCIDCSFLHFNGTISPLHYENSIWESLEPSYCPWR